MQMGAPPKTLKSSDGFGNMGKAIQAMDIIDLFYHTMYYNWIKTAMTPLEGAIAPNLLPPRWLVDTEMMAQKQRHIDTMGHARQTQVPGNDACMFRWTLREVFQPFTWSSDRRIPSPSDMDNTKIPIVGNYMAKTI